MQSLDNTLSSKQTPFRSSIHSNRKKKAHKLVPKIAEKSKTIKRALDYSDKVKRRSKKLSKKKKDLKGGGNPLVAPKKMDRK